MSAHVKSTAIFMGFAVLAVGCSAEHTGLSTQQSLGTGGCGAIMRDFFTQEFHGFLKAQCNACHTLTGSGNGAFADLDVNLSYSEFADRGFALIKNKALDPNHQSPYTGTQHQTQLAAIEAKWVTANEQLVACQTPSPGSGTPPTPPPPPPGSGTAVFWLNAQEMAATNTNKTLNWNLASSFERPEIQFAGATFSLDVRTVTSPTGDKSYQFANPRLSTGSDAIQVNLIEIKINNVFIESANTYRTVTRRIPTSTQQTLATTAMVVPYEFATTDRLSVGFQVIEKITFNPVRFATLIGAGGVFAANCVGCHGATNPSGGLNLTNLQGLINQFQVIPFNPDASEVYVRMNDAQRPMPTGGLLGQNARDQVRAWIADGALP